MNRLDGRIAVVTGGTQGLGAAIARAAAEAGAAGVVICGRSVAKGASVAAAIIRDTGVPVEYAPADLARPEDCRAVIAAADARFGRLDVLVNAAGVTDRGTLLDTSPALFDHILAVNTRAPFFLMQEAVRLMIRDRIEGAVVNIGTVSAFTGQPFLCPYAVSKGALATLTRNAAFGLLRNRIRVNQLDIGWMETEGEDRIQREAHGAEPDWAAAAGARLPFGRLLQPEEVARAVLFLASPDSGMMTGAVIPFDQSVRGGYAGAAPVPSAPMGG